MKQYLLKVWMTAALSLLVVGGVWGQAVTYSPSIGATNVSVSPVLSIEFDGEVTIGSGNIYVYSGDYSTYIEIPAQIKSPPPGPYSYSMNELLSVVGNTLFIDLTEGLLPNSTMLWVSIDASVISVDENEWDILDTWEPNFPEWSFTTVSAPTPLTATLSPADDATNVPVSTSTFEIRFSEDVKMADGVFFVSLFEKGVTPSKRNVELYSGLISDTIVSIDFDFQFLYGKEYEIVFPANAIKSVTTGALFPGLSADEWSFTTEVAPDPLLMITSSLSPENGSVEVPRAPTLEVSFKQAITWGPSGVLTIHRYDNDSTAATISRGETGATISQDTLSIIFSSDRLEYGTKYYVIIDEGFVKALNTSAVFAGLTEKNIWTFTTETAPPFWEEGYPMIANQTAAVFDLLGKVDQDGTYYFVVSDEDAMLTYEEISTAATSGGTGGFLAAGNDVVGADTEFEAAISTSNLESGFNYYLFVYTSNGDKDGEIVRLAIDRTAPRLRTTGTFPSDGYSVLPIDADIVLTFSEKIFGVEEGELVELTTENAGSFIKLVTGETSVTTEISVSEDGKVFTLSPTDDLSENTSYSVEFSELADAQFNVATIPAHTFSTDKLNVWIGGSGASFSEDSNWSDGEFVAGKSVRIPKYEGVDYPVFDVTDDVEVNNLTIEAGAMLDQKSGSLKINGVFTLESSSDYNATYIPGGTLTVVGDSVRIEQVIPSGSVSYMISSPTDNATISNIGTTGPLYYYDNETDAWVLHGSGPMNARSEERRVGKES